jgi:DNA repair protein RecO (recombination protein O)
LFEAYDQAITALRALGRGPISQASIEPVLRRFELKLLQEVGFAVQLTHEAGTHAPIVAEREYLYVVERGPVPAAEGETRNDAVRLAGLTLIDLERGRFEDTTTIAQAKSLMRLLINHSLNGQELATRAMVRDLQALESDSPSPLGEAGRGP